MRNKDKVRVYNFIETLKTWEFILELIYMNIFNKPSKRLERKVEKFTNEYRRV